MTSCLHVITSTLLFNLALLCHTQAYHGDGQHTILPHPTYLLNALQMYQLIIQMFHRNSYNDSYVDENINQMVVDDNYVEDSATFASYMKMIATISCNNHAHACFALGNYEQYTNCMDTLQHILCCDNENESIKLDESKIYLLHIEKDTNDNNDNDILYHTTVVMDGCDIYDDIKLNLLLFNNSYSFLPLVALAA
jgi:hypothetical protein